jgi:hypothetical protein
MVENMGRYNSGNKTKYRQGMNVGTRAVVSDDG